MGLTNGAAAARQAAAAAVLPVVVVQAALAVGAIRVVGAVPTVTTVAGGAVQLGVVVALRTLTIAVAGCGAIQPGVTIVLTFMNGRLFERWEVELTQTLVRVVSRRSPPRPVVEKGFADVAVVTLRVVFAVAHQASLAVLHALAGVAVTLTPVKQCTHTTFIVKMNSLRVQTGSCLQLF